jgi:hypothetical protein
MVVEIALGIVLAVIILALSPYIIAAVVCLAGLAIGIAVIAVPIAFLMSEDARISAQKPKAVRQSTTTQKVNHSKQTAEPQKPEVDTLCWYQGAWHWPSSAWTLPNDSWDECDWIQTIEYVNGKEEVYLTKPRKNDSQ